MLMSSKRAYGGNLEPDAAIADHEAYKLSRSGGDVLVMKAVPSATPRLNGRQLHFIPYRHQRQRRQGNSEDYTLASAATLSSGIPVANSEYL